MKYLKQQLSEDLVITKSSNSVREHSDTILVELLIDIFSRVPAKSIAKFRCVSKFWESILGRPDFTELFLTKSVARPRILFAFTLNKELLFFSSPQPQNPNNNSCLVATRYKYLPLHLPAKIFEICKPVCGLVFLQSLRRKARVICNPATGEVITLRSLLKSKVKHINRNYFGFDPISKEFKVLCMTWPRYGKPNWVLTLGTGKRIWRTIQDPIFPHIARCGGICINGVLYYGADFEGSYKIVCFDFSLEKFSFINMDEDMSYMSRYQLTLFNNQGKLGAHRYRGWSSDEVFMLWVLEDAGKHKWSKRMCLVPKTLNMYMIVGMTGTGEIVFSPIQLSNPFYIFYYNIERNTFTRVNIQGFEEFEDQCISFYHTFLDYVETMKFI